MKLFRYYRNAVIYPSLFILFFCVVYALIDNYKSGWNTTKTAMITAVISSFVYSLVMGVLSLSIFLNKFQQLHKNLFWNILTWFFLPFLYIGIFLIHDIQNRITYDFGFKFGFIYLLIMTAPFVIGLYASFIKYRQKITAP